MPTLASPIICGNTFTELIRKQIYRPKPDYLENKYIFKINSSRPFHLCESSICIPPTKSAIGRDVAIRPLCKNDVLE